MNREDIIRMAREVGLPHWYETEGVVNEELLIKFAELVAQHQREKDRQQAVALLRQLHDSFSLESAELRLHMWSQEKQA